ncbi:MAG: hypothetical protein QG594_2384 [Bacteroidota bacterium]|nr:hypothetical protein [Bacteroidota bacterium]
MRPKKQNVKFKILKKMSTKKESANKSANKSANESQTDFQKMFAETIGIEAKDTTNSSSNGRKYDSLKNFDSVEARAIRKNIQKNLSNVKDFNTQVAKFGFTETNKKTARKLLSYYITFIGLKVVSFEANQIFGNLKNAANFKHYELMLKFLALYVKSEKITDFQPFVKVVNLQNSKFLNFS